MAKKAGRKSAKKKMIPMASDTQLDVALVANDTTGVGQAAVDVVEEMRRDRIFMRCRYRIINPRSQIQQIQGVPYEPGNYCGSYF